MAKNTLISLGTTLSFALAAGAMAALASSKSTPGASGEVPDLWPEDSRIARDPDTPVLLMFAHPRCACTRASLSELRALMSRFEHRVEARVLFALPDGVTEDWADTDLWRSAASIPGVEPELDRGEEEAHRFGARTSGHVVLYDRRGHLLYSGGITGARGHEGDNAGLQSAASAIDSARGSRSRPVFGCALENPEREKER